MTLNEVRELILTGKIKPYTAFYEVEDVQFVVDREGDIYSDYEHEFWEIAENHDNTHRH